MIQVQNDNWVLNRLVPCLKCMKPACWVLLFYSVRTELLTFIKKNLRSKQFCPPRKGNTGNMLLTSWNCQKYFYQYLTVYMQKILKLKKPPSKVTQKYSKNITPIAAKTAQTKEFLFQNVAYSSNVYKAGPFGIHL